MHTLYFVKNLTVRFLNSFILVSGLVMSSSPAFASGASWDEWDGRDPKSRGSLPSEITMTAEEKREKAKKFTFVKDAIRFRLNQSFFDLGTDSFEDILRSMGVLDASSKLLRFPVENVDPRNQKPVRDVSWIQYKTFKSQVKLRHSGLTIRLDTVISDSIIYKPTWNDTSFSGGISEKCKIRMRGRISMVIDARITEDADVAIAIPVLQNDDFEMKTNGCNNGSSQLLTGFLVNKFGPGQLQGSLQTLFNDMFNNKDGSASFFAADLAKDLSKKGIYVNAPSLGHSYDPSAANGHFKMEMGFLGYLSNSNGSPNIRINNPKNNYLNAMGFEWVLSSGFEARSKNRIETTPVVASKNPKAEFLGWGVAPMQKTGSPVEFDAAASISEAYVGSFFNSLFNSGFFNWQLMDKTVSKAYSINPLQRKALFAGKLSNGEELTEANYIDSRMEMQMLAPPTLGLQGDQTILLSIPKFRLSYFAKVKGYSQEQTLLEFDSRFRLRAKLQFTEDGKFRFDFSEQPVVDFVMLERKTVHPTVTDEQMFEALNKEVAQILSTVEVDLPLLKGRKLDVAYLGIDGNPDTGRSLSVYLNVSNLNSAIKSTKSRLR